MPFAPMLQLRHTAPALRRGLLWLLVLAWCWQGQASLLQQLLGRWHHHPVVQRSAAPLHTTRGVHETQGWLQTAMQSETQSEMQTGWQAVAQQVDAWASALRARRASALLAHGQPGRHAPAEQAAHLPYPAKHGHPNEHLQAHVHAGLHEGLERHHHAQNDVTVTTSGEVLADEGLAGNGSAGGLGTLALPAELPAGLQPLRRPAAVPGWPTGGPRRWTSADLRLPERPPRA